MRGLEVAEWGGIQRQLRLRERRGGKRRSLLGHAAQRNQADERAKCWR
jgi:hypothetical protein